MIVEAHRGGIKSQHSVSSVLTNLRPQFEFVSNVVGSNSDDVTILRDGSKVGAIEVKSDKSGSQNVTIILFDSTISIGKKSVFDDLLKSIARSNDEDADDLESFLEAIGGSAGAPRPIPPDLAKNLDDRKYVDRKYTYSHRLVRKSGDQFVYALEPEDDDRETHRVFRALLDDPDLVTAQMNVYRTDDTLTTKSAWRKWATSGNISTIKSIRYDDDVRERAFDLMVDHLHDGDDNYLMFDTPHGISGYLIPGKDDILKLGDIGVDDLTSDDIVKAGVKTYGNAGVGKIRLGLSVTLNTGRKID